MTSFPLSCRVSSCARNDQLLYRAVNVMWDKLTKSSLMVSIKFCQDTRSIRAIENAWKRTFEATCDFSKLSRVSSSIVPLSANFKALAGVRSVSPEELKTTHWIISLRGALTMWTPSA